MITTDQYEQVLKSALATASTSSDLITALSTFDDSGKNERLAYILNNYVKTHLSSISEATLIQGAIATL